MKLIGKMDDFLVYEVGPGRYISVNPKNEKWRAEWTWYGQLGKWCDRFTKLEDDPDDGVCVRIIEKNKEDILKKLQAIDKMDEDNPGEMDEFLKEQNDFYDSLEPGREYDWYDGYVDEINEE